MQTYIEERQPQPQRDNRNRSKGILCMPAMKQLHQGLRHDQKLIPRRRNNAIEPNEGNEIPNIKPKHANIVTASKG
jgi:hypothetical protein